MKKLYAVLFLMMMYGSLSSQTYFGPNYLHLCSPLNSIGDFTLLDPSILGNNPADKIIFTHLWGDPTIGHEEYMLKSHGLWWTGDTWSIFNETEAELDTNLAFNVLNANINGTAFTHTVTSGNVNLNWSDIDNPLLNGHPDVLFFISKTWGNGIYDTAHVGIWYDHYTDKWAIYNENKLDSLKVNSTYNIFIPDAGTTAYKHVATDNYYTTNLDNPLLNDNPDAMIFVVHDYTNSPGNEGYINDEIGVWYDGSNWTIYNENIDTLFPGATFNVLIVKPLVTSVASISKKNQLIKVFPNPASDQFSVLLNRSYSKGEFSLILSTADGRTVMQKSYSGNQNGKVTMDVSVLPEGLYLLTAKTQNGTLTAKVNVIR